MTATPPYSTLAVFRDGKGRRITTTDTGIDCHAEAGRGNWVLVRKSVPANVAMEWLRGKVDFLDPAVPQFEG